MGKDLIGIMYRIKASSSQKTSEAESQEIQNTTDENLGEILGKPKSTETQETETETETIEKTTGILPQNGDETEKTTEVSTQTELKELINNSLVIGGVGIGAFALGLVMGVLLSKIKKKNESKVVHSEEERMGNSATAYSNFEYKSEAVQNISVGKVHNIGKRQGQQDSLGVSEIQNGIIAVVADGMGGLSDGDKVSQKIVMTVLQDAQRISAREFENPLYAITAHANNEVNRMLGAGGRYKSGSTLIAVVAEKTGFHWVSVGDSRIYLYRNGMLLQINREHIYEAELMKQAVNGEISFAEVKMDRQKNGLTSFIGMGDLEFIDGSTRKVPIQKGDAILLMSDGVFNTVPEEEIADILVRTSDTKTAEAELEKCVLKYNNPKQDNFTAIILRF